MRNRLIYLGLSVLSAVAFSACADVTLPALFSDHMVLQKSKAVPIWGKAEPGEKVKVSVAGLNAETLAGADGTWKITLDLAKAAEGPHTVVVEGKNRLEIGDVLMGEVWVCAGQSNMGYPQLDTELHAKEEVPRCANPKLRTFVITKANDFDRLTFTVKPNLEGKWVVAAPTNASLFSGVGYYFGKKLNHELNGIAVGLVNTAVGNTALEQWLSPGMIHRDPAIQAAADQQKREFLDYPDLVEVYYKSYVEWQRQFGREDKKANPRRFPTVDIPPQRVIASSDPVDSDRFAAAAVATQDWKTVKLPALSANLRLPDSGAIWFRKTITIPAEMAGKDCEVAGGAMMDSVAAYWNSEPIGYNHPRAQVGWAFPVPGKLVKAGENVLAIRLFSPVGKLGFPGNPASLHLNSIPLAGDWLAKVEFELPVLSAEAQAALKTVPRFPGRPELGHIAGFCFQTRMNAVIPYGIRGVIWYQGENNANRSADYRRNFPMLIEDWRTQWGQGEFPFYFCQLPNYYAKSADPAATGGWIDFREAQASALTVPQTGMAVLIDTGEVENLHPRNKQDPGERLAAIALARTYDRKIPYSGPVYESLKIEGGKIRLRFLHTDGGLVVRKLPSDYVLTTEGSAPKTAPLVLNSPKSELQGFAVCGKDRNWTWADAHIDGDTVVVESSAVTEPLAVRYAWSANPTCNLYNGAGFPAGPFRTDTY